MAGLRPRGRSASDLLHGLSQARRPHFFRGVLQRRRCRGRRTENIRRRLVPHFRVTQNRGLRQRRHGQSAPAQFRQRVYRPRFRFHMFRLRRRERRFYEAFALSRKPQIRRDRPQRGTSVDCRTVCKRQLPVPVDYRYAQSRHLDQNALLRLQNHTGRRARRRGYDVADRRNGQTRGRRDSDKQRGLERIRRAVGSTKTPSLCR